MGIFLTLLFMAIFNQRQNRCHMKFCLGITFTSLSKAKIREPSRFLIKRKGPVKRMRKNTHFFFSPPKLTVPFGWGQMRHVLFSFDWLTRVEFESWREGWVVYNLRILLSTFGKVTLDFYVKKAEGVLLILKTLLIILDYMYFQIAKTQEGGRAISLFHHYWLANEFDAYFWS